MSTTTDTTLGRPGLTVVEVGGEGEPHGIVTADVYLVGPTRPPVVAGPQITEGRPPTNAERPSVTLSSEEGDHSCCSGRKGWDKRR